jgi:hypothetical protein
MVGEVLQGMVSIVIGCLVGMLGYLIPSALWPRPQYQRLPRAVVLVPESECRSLRCVFSSRTGHLVEVELLERGERLMKVAWPSAFRHLDEWVPLADSAIRSVGNEIIVFEELPAYPQSSTSEFEQWLAGVAAKLDALDAEVVGTGGH